MLVRRFSLSCLLFAVLPSLHALGQTVSASASLPDTPGFQASPLSQPSQSSAATIPVSGTVIDPDGASINGALVTLTGSAAAPSRADSNGHFLINVPAATAFTLDVTAKGFEPATRNFDAAQAALDAVTFQLKVATLDTDVDVTLPPRELAELEVHDEEQQRLFGLIPNYFVYYGVRPAPLSARQKFSLAFHTALDPAVFAGSAIVAGINQGTGALSGYGSGFPGYATRYGAAYGDALTGIVISNAVVPALLHQDPRYWVKGIGSTRSRVGYALATPYRTHGDNGRWQPNYSNFLGSLAAIGVANAYAPATDRNSAPLLFANAAIGIASDSVGALLEEFVFNKFTTRAKHKPTKAKP